MKSITSVATYMVEHADFLAVEIVEGVINDAKLEISNLEKEQAIRMYNDLLVFFGESIIECDKEGVPETLYIWSKRNAEEQVASGGEISEIIVRYPATRELITDILTKISLDFGLSIKEHSFILKRINAMLDISINETVFAFERLSTKIKAESQKEIARLSAPVVPIKDGVAVLPLIGIVDSFRATYIIETVIPKIAELKINYLIVDFSGILTIDEEVARYLYQIESVLRLLGSKTIVTGLRPELAQIVVNSGIDMSSIKTFAHLKHALESLK